mmetsp:Transcript_27331/g.55105  ORF Transcript_27331/g.55105 Transcript_27331/m.55105 type:complete len:98 (+) Transcript_27331:610-903(+)
MCSSAAAFLAASRIALASCTSGAVRAEDSDVCEVSLFVTFVMSSLEGDLGGLPADDSASPMIIAFYYYTRYIILQWYGIMDATYGKPDAGFSLAFIR